MKWHVYMLACERDCLYTGIALDVVARFELHRSGKGAAYTRAYRPRGILASKACASRSRALKLEHALKQLKPPEKLAWAACNPFGGQRISRVGRCPKPRRLP
jgi:putative endonuclease